MSESIRSIIAISMLFFLTACGTYSDMGYQNGRFYLQAEKIPVELDAAFVTQKRTNFSSLFLQQNILRLQEGNLVVYENAKTDLSYEFEPTLTRIIEVIFQTRKKIPLLIKSHIHAYHVVLPNGQVLNLIAQQDNSQQLKLLYGMSTLQFNRILKQLDHTAPSAHYQDVLTLYQADHALLTQWDDMKVHFYPLVVPLPRLMTGY
ncbi:hypothetical protein IMZ28_04995 [Sulfurovum indicum]|uniref:Uncharacterized protein n=2 Tax=Sulfurovum TaxID=265570 RepID=A0A7M1S658_9BACT|nr:hypothetical protein [Sulfurovum indicum]QOR62826.1 hypothetical protein IMZ28_04995 [Sulfurovum indicum]